MTNEDYILFLFNIFIVAQQSASSQRHNDGMFHLRL